MYVTAEEKANADVYLKYLERHPKDFNLDIKSALNKCPDIIINKLGEIIKECIESESEGYIPGEEDYAELGERFYNYIKVYINNKGNK